MIFCFYFGNTTRTNIFLPLKATQLKVVMVLRNELQHPYEHLRFKQNIQGTNPRLGSEM